MRATGGFGMEARTAGITARNDLQVTRKGRIYRKEYD